jgi:3-hydroxypropanoate dehydrogenase
VTSRGAAQIVGAVRRAPEMPAAVPLAQIFDDARTCRSWSARPVKDADLQEAFERARLGPTSLNGQPMRIVFLRGSAKGRLAPALRGRNVDYVAAAPVTAIMAYDLRFFDHLPRLYPHRGARSRFEAEPALAEETAFRNGTLQGAYFMLAARALGLAVGPMSGFSRETVDAAFFAGSSVRSNFLLNLGYGADDAPKPRDPRLEFAEACRFA